MNRGKRAMRVFLSYSHADEAWKERVKKHLGVLGDRLFVWDDHRIQAGDDWLPEIERALAECNVASKFIRQQEIPPLLERRVKDGVRVIPVILTPCAWQAVP